MKSYKQCFGVALALMCASTAFSATGASNGGGRIGLEFTQAALRAVTVLVERHDELPVELKVLDPKAISDAIQNTRLFVKDTLCVVDPTTKASDCPVARNYPDQKMIEISKEEWETLSANPKLQVAIGLHEYLGILNIESNVYYLSARLNTWLNGDEPIENRMAYLSPGKVFTDGNMRLEILTNDKKTGKIYVRYTGPVWNLSGDVANKSLTAVLSCKYLLAQACEVGLERENYPIYVSVFAGGQQIDVQSTGGKHFILVLETEVPQQKDPAQKN